MCRMILAVGEVQVYSILQDLMIMAKDQNKIHELNANLGRGSWKHTDGWGAAYLQQGQWVVIKSVKALCDNQDIEQFKSVKTSLALLHARKRIGSKTSLENTHPFIETDSKLGECVFCHNGFIQDKIEFNHQFKLKGNTDSEKLFYSILTDTANTEVALAVRQNFSRHPKVRGSNIILASKNYSYVGIGKNILPQYYGMVIGKSDRLLVISSEKLPSFSHLAWTELQQGDIVTVDNKTMEVKMEKEVF